MLALTLSLALTATGDAPSSVDLLESERSQLVAELHQADAQRSSQRPSWFFLGSGAVTMLSGFLALEVVGTVTEPARPGSEVQIAPSTYVLGVIVAGGFAAIVGAVMAIWIRVKNAEPDSRVDALRARIEQLDARIATELPAQVAPDGNSFVPRASQSF